MNYCPLCNRRAFDCHCSPSSLIAHYERQIEERDGIIESQLCQGCDHSAIAELQSKIDSMKQEVCAVVESIPGFIRVREGGGPEDVFKSLAVSVAKLVSEVMEHREARDIIEKKIAGLEELLEVVKSGMAKWEARFDV